MITNYFSPLEFQVNVKRMPNVEFFIQRATIPGVQNNPVEVPTPFNRMFSTADKLTYAPLELSFIVDENLRNYIEVFNWIKGTTFPEQYTQYRNQSLSENGIESDIIITALNSNKNPAISVTFTSCIPVALSELVLDTTAPDIMYPTATLSLAYTYFDIATYGA